jgi:hypothetical protein
LHRANGNLTSPQAIKFSESNSGIQHTKKENVIMKRSKKEKKKKTTNPLQETPASLP